ncbi:NfeD family protein [Roseomonas haemaphysalidis]|uniref:NfeD family protein n=1 Tax=Roseomonas haemaphysalidis TaxID=2768162 RepID=A0ABS3KV56_9PROT|nr:NfeD family protein [Roseomonas haemaphysalidis]MBO1081361.1 NfeD family protein [Roseomonas haemaphysalidis]
MDAWAIWVGLGLLAMGAELLLPGAFLVWIGAAAVGTGLLLWLANPGTAATLLVFIALLALGIGLSLRVFRRKPGGAGEGLNTPSSGLVGRVGVLLAADGPSGRARIGDSDWPVRLEDAAEVGARVEVVAVQGMTLLVRAAR